LSQPRLEPGRTVFIDRDGTINESPPEGEYLSSPSAVRLIPGAAEAIHILNDYPARVIVITNQRGIALGRMSEADLAAVNERVAEELARHGAKLDGVFHCPHHAGTCDCRKPGTGMFERAAREVEGVEIKGGAMIGDSAIDIEAGRHLELTTVRLGESGALDPVADHTALDLLAAVRWLIAER
jgi:D-glycero-D-manno-heptose 1,7-bisphosphate phosphatase